MKPLEIKNDPVRWFDGLGACACGKPATGVLRGSRNESYGVYCIKCATSRLDKAKKARMELAIKWEAKP